MGLWYSYNSGYGWVTDFKDAVKLLEELVEDGQVDLSGESLPPTPDRADLREYLFEDAPKLQEYLNTKTQMMVEFHVLHDMSEPKVAFVTPGTFLSLDRDDGELTFGGARYITEEDEAAHRKFQQDHGFASLEIGFFGITTVN